MFWGVFSVVLVSFLITFYLNYEKSYMQKLLEFDNQVKDVVSMIDKNFKEYTRIVKLEEFRSICILEENLEIFKMMDSEEVNTLLNQQLLVSDESMTEEEKLFYLAYSKTVNLVNELLPNIKELYENEYDILELIFIPFYDESMNQTVFAEKFNQSQLIELQDGLFMFNEPIQQKDNIWAVYQVVEWEDEILGYFQLMYKTINTEEIFPYSHLNKGLYYVDNQLYTGNDLPSDLKEKLLPASFEEASSILKDEGYYLSQHTSEVMNLKVIHYQLKNQLRASVIAQTISLFELSVILLILLFLLVSYILFMSIVKPCYLLVDYVKRCSEGNYKIPSNISKSWRYSFLMVRNAYLENERLLNVKDSQSQELEYAWKRTLVASQAKTHFLAKVSHELKTPLNAIKGYVQVLKLSIDQPKQKKQLEIIEHSSATVVLLEQNYRSKQMILNAANDVIRNNSGRRDKQLWSDRGEGESIEYHRASDGDIEATYIADKIAYMRRDTYDYHDFAVLYRTNSQSRAIEQALLRQNIPYRLVGGQSYFKRKEIKDLMAYLRLICNPDDDLSFVRVVNEPKRGIGAASIDKLNQFAKDSELSLMASIQDATGVVAKATLNKLMDFKTMIYMLRAQIEDYSLASFIDLVLNQTGYLEMLENENTIEADSRIDNLGEFKSMATQFEEVDLDEILAEEESEERAEELSTMTKLIILLNDLMLQTDTETEEEANESKVTLMTIHAAKGLEFPVVFICGFEDGIFPLRSAIEQGADDLEEERRLAYVAITRAEDLLFITNAQSRYQYGMRSANAESMFIKEISDKYLNKTGIEARPRPLFTLQEAVESKAPKRQLKTVNLNSDSSWASGDKVEHDTFGEGVVVGVKGEVISIAFSAPHGIKKLMGSHPALKKRS